MSGRERAETQAPTMGTGLGNFALSGPYISIVVVMEDLWCVAWVIYRDP